MLTDDLKKKHVAVKVEISDLNILAAFYLRKFSRISFLFQKSIREHTLEELTALRYMENGLILHLTNLDDDTSDYSFRTIRKDLAKEVKDQQLIKKLNGLIDSYRKGLSNFKNKHRNKRIAHLNEMNDKNFDVFLNFETEFRPLILQANQIGDLIWGERLNHKFRLGSLEGNIDLRKMAEENEFNIHLRKDFT